MAQKVSYWLLITLVLSLGFGQLLRFEFFGVPLYLHDLLVIMLLLLQGLALQVIAKDLRGQALTGLKLFLLGLALGWLRAATLYPLSALLIPSLYTFRLLAYLALYFSLKSSKILVSNVYFLTSGCIALIIGLTQYILLPDMRWAQYLGWDDHLNRLTLPHFDPTFTALMLGLFALTLKRSHWYLGLLVYLGILFTYSRSVWLSLILTGFLFIKNKKILLVSGALVLLSIFTLPQKFGEGTNLLRTYSVSSRVQYDLAYIQKYRWDLLIGRGMNTVILDSFPTESPSHATGPNNSYLYLLLTSGILGLVGWGVFMFSLYQKSTYKPMLIFFFIAALFNNVLFYPFALLWVLLVEARVPSAT